MKPIRFTLIITMLGLLAGSGGNLLGQGTTFTYQGLLRDTNGPVTNSVSIQFRLYAAPSGGVAVWQEMLPSIPVTNGLFAVALGQSTPADATVFNGSARWLGISVNGSPELTPRQSITATPYAVTAGNVTGVVPSSGLTGTYSAPVVFNNPANNLTGSGAGLTSLNASQLTTGTVPASALSNAWKTGGNAGTTAGTHFLGTTDNQPLELKVNGARALRLQPGAVGLPTVIGGAANNVTLSGAEGVTISGGSQHSAGGANPTIGGGRNNSIESNTITATIGGGTANAIQLNVDHGVIGGGNGNVIQNNADLTTIGGGNVNTIHTNAHYATIPGGQFNEASGKLSFAAGHRAKANHDGAFVWADSTDADFASTTTNQFSVRAGGGARFETGGAGMTLDGQLVLSGTINAAQLADGAVTSAKLAAGSVTTSNLTAGAVGANQLASNAVTTSALANGAVTAAKVEMVPVTLSLITFSNPSPQFDDFFGHSVAVVGNDKVLIGAEGNHNVFTTNIGAAYLFSTNGTLLLTITNPAPAAGDFFGQTVAPFDNTRMLIGAQKNDLVGVVDVGAVYLFGTNGTLLTTFTNPTPVAGDQFGNSMAAVGTDLVLIGARFDNTGANSAGAAYLFNTNGAWLNTFTNPTPANADLFGHAVAALGSDRVLIAALSDDTVATNAGIVYLFNTNGTLLTSFTNPAQVAAGFGSALAVIGTDRVLIGAEFDSGMGVADAGAAYLFNTNGTLLTTFTSPTPEAFEVFGSSVAAVGSDRVLIGARQDKTGATEAGAAYLFNTNGTLLAAFTNPTPAALEFFGESVAALDANRILIGASSDFTSIGAAYLFNIDIFTPGLVADGVRTQSITTASLEDGAVTAAKLDPTIGVWTQSGSNVFRLSGNVGIGTNSPTEKLVVAGNILATGSVSANTFLGNGSALTGIHSLDAADGSPTDAVFVNNSGRVGINLTNPLHLLHVGTTLGTNAFNASANVIAIEDAVVNGRATFLALAGTGGPDTSNRVEVQIEAVESTRRGIMGTTTEHPLYVRVGNSDVVVLATNRFVGINTSSPTERLHVIGNILASGTITPNSDRNAKTDIQPVDVAAILERVSTLPIQQWRFKAEPDQVKHVGPMAQDFRAAFGLGAHETAIATVDADGVALAAIQGLNEKVEVRGERAEGSIQELRDELKRRDAENAALQTRLEKLERLLSALAQASTAK